MLSERQLEALLKVFEARAQEVTEGYLRRIGEHLKQIGALSGSDVHRLLVMKRFNANLETTKRQIARAAEQSAADIEAVFRAVAESNAEFAREMFATDHSPEVKAARAKMLSTPLERILKAQLRVTAQQFSNLSRTTIDSQLYRDAVDVAIQTVQSGMTDYSSAIRKAMKEAAADGLRVVYPSGYARRLDTAIRQNVLDGVRALNQDVLDQLGKEYGSDGVEISAHALCAADHLAYQGRQFSKKDFERIQNNLRRPFCQWNCKHTIFPIILGVTEPAHTQEQLDAFARNSSEEIEIDGRRMSRYEWSQEQRRIETAVRAQKNIAVAAKASGDDYARREAQRNINRLTGEYDKLSKASGLTLQPERMTVSGFRRVKTVDELKNPARYGIMTEEEQRLQNIREKIRSDAVSKAINPEKQGRHIVGSPQYTAGRSYIHGTIETAQSLVNKYHGSGTPMMNSKGEWKNKEVVRTDAIIGVNVDPDQHTEAPTKRFVIHYSKTGTHIVPTHDEE